MTHHLISNILFAQTHFETRMGIETFDRNHLDILNIGQWTYVHTIGRALFLKHPYCSVSATSWVILPLQANWSSAQ